MKHMKEYAEMRKAELKAEIAKHDRKPQLTIYQVGDDEASNRYIRNKIKDCEEVGIIACHVKCPEDVSAIDLILDIQKRQNYCDGIIVQQPLPEHMNVDAINGALTLRHDVDGFHPMSPYHPATAKGIVDYLEWRDFHFEGAKVTIIGRSNIVGKPLARMLTDKDCTVTLCHSKSRWSDIWNSVCASDLVICAVGRAGFLDCSSLSIPVIDVGINFDEEGKLCGDCFVWNGTQRNVSPVPGGVGLLTRVALLENVVEAAYGKR